MKKVFLVLLLLNAVRLFAAPFNGNIMQFKQPDGSFVDVKLYGTEYYMRGEGLDRYTVIRDLNTQWICYAVLSPDGRELLSSGVKYTANKNNKTNLAAHPDVAFHLDISEKAREAIIFKNKKKLDKNSALNANSKTEIHPVIGNIKGLCIVVDFSDETCTLPLSEFFDFCNNLNYSNFGNNGSLKKFYSDVSGGLVEYENVVYGIYRAPLTFAAYDAMPYSQGAQEILGLALNWIDSQGFDFSTLTTNPDGSIEALNLMYTGNPPNWAQGMWWHMGSYTNFSADGVHSDSYNCSPANSPLTLATVAHENGHMIGKWPDTYKYNNTTGPDGIGAFDLMCWYGDSYNPVPPNPHFRSNASWGNVVDVTNYNGLIHDTANSRTCYKYLNLNDTNEFFLFENRKQEGRSTSIEDEGLTIWHIDRNGDNQTIHHEVYLVHANNDINNHMQACFHQGFNQEYGATTSPNSDFFNGNPSGLRAWEISQVQDVMTYKLGAGVAAPTFHLTYINISGDNNANGFLEPAESGNANVDIGNFGQINSGVTYTSCTAVGVNAGLVTVNTGPVPCGILQPNFVFPVFFNLTISPSAQLGSEIELKFEVSDGTYSNYITKKIIIGQQIIINNQQISTCSAIFYDHGGPYGNYANMTDYVITFIPPSVNQTISANFLTFDLEDEPNCAYDFLEIYNGPDQTSPLIGQYCGANSPGTVVSTHPSGKLTFNFHADEGVTGSGWSAVISCGMANGIVNLQEDKKVMIFPNPTNGILTVSYESNDLLYFSIEDVLGREVYPASVLATGDSRIDLSCKADGIYILKMRGSQGLRTEKILKSR